LKLQAAAGVALMIVTFLSGYSRDLLMNSRSKCWESYYFF